MSATITESSTYTASVITPSDGDAVNGASILAGLQPLANRTKWLNDQITIAQTYASYLVSGSGVQAADFTLTLDAQHGGFSLATNQVTVPSAGTYLVCASLVVSSSDTTADLQFITYVFKNGSTYVAFNGLRAGTTGYVAQNWIGIVPITTPASEKISVHAGTTILSAAAASRLTLVRLI